jgi:hypothetical protein
MKKLAAVLIAIGALSGCVVHPVGPGYAHRGHHDRDRDGVSNRVDRDRDGDGVANRYDRRPNNPYRY